MVVVPDEGIDLLPEVAWQIVVLHRNAVLQGLVPALDLALGLRMIRGTADMIYLLVCQPISQFARDLTAAAPSARASPALPFLPCPPG